MKLKRWIFWLLIIGFLWLVVSQFNEAKRLVETMVNGQWQWIVAALGIQGLYYIAFTGSYQRAFATVGVKSNLWELMPVTFGSLFVNVVAPAGGATGAALFVDEAARRGQSPTRAATGTLLQLVCDFGAFTLILITGLIYLSIQQDLQLYEALGALTLLAITLALSSVLGLGFWRPHLLERLLNWIQRTSIWINERIKFIPSLTEDWAEKNAREFNQASWAIVDHPYHLAQTLALTLAAHLLDLTTLYFLFRTFHQPIKFGTLIAGYAMGILFWIISITPQGIGVVEGVMALVYTSLKVPAETATAVSLVFRGLTFWLPLLLGFILLRRVKTFSLNQRILSEIWNVRIAAILTGIMGVINVLSAVTPSLGSRLRFLEQFTPLVVRHGSHLAAGLAGFALILVARNLWRRKRIAWLVALVTLVISAISHILKGLDYEEALLAGGLAIWLFGLKPNFHARSDSPSVRQGLRAMAFSMLFTLGYGVAGFYLLDRHYSDNFGLWAAMRQTVAMFTQFYDPGLEPLTQFGRYFADSIYMIGAATFGYGLLMLARPVLLRRPSTPQERQRARQIIEAYGRSSLARIALLDDKNYIFSQGGSVLPYTIEGRVAVTLGDPIGPPDDIAPMISGFVKQCQQNDWIPVFYQTKPDTLEYYKSAGFKALCIGEEGSVDITNFSLAGRENKWLRTASNRLTKQGYQVIVHQAPLSNKLLSELHQVSDEWLTTMRGSEKRFSLGWFEDDYIRSSPVAAVHSPSDLITAFANIVPEYQLNEITIDLMRHRREIEPGTMDFLFVELFSWAKENGYAAFNLGLSALAGIGEHPDDPMIERTLHYIYQHINQFYNFKGLHDFKEKFRPTWSPRYLIYPDTASLAAAWLAVVQANSGKHLP